MRNNDLGIVRRLLGEARPYWPHLISLLLLNLLSTPFSLLSPLPVKIVVDSVIGSQPVPKFVETIGSLFVLNGKGAILAFAGGLVLFVALLNQLYSLGSSLLATYTGEKLAADFQAKLFRHAQGLSLSYLDSHGTSDVTYRIRHNAPAIRQILVDKLMPLIASSLKFVALVCGSLLINWRLALVVMAVSPILYALSRFFKPTLRHQWREVHNLHSSAMSVIQEVISAIRVVKAFGQEDQEQERFVRQTREGYSRYVRVTFAQGSYSLLAGLTTAAATAAILVYGTVQVRSGALSVGELLMVIAYVSQLFSPLEKLSSTSVGLQSSMASAERALSLFDQPPGLIEVKDPRPIRRATGNVVFRNVTFAYSTGQPVLHDISFQVSQGTHVGISGTTGAGKTTLISLLTRFYDPSSGEILLDGVDLRKYDLADLRNQFAIVLQEPVLFSTSISQNIAYARRGCSVDEVIQAAKAANAHEFIMRLPEGYDTPVGERGMSLSGGERQRISLARAFLKRAPILILDEPTSSVDLHTEAAIMESMIRLIEGHTAFIIAHRLSTLERCHMRLVIEDGRLHKVTHGVAAFNEAIDSRGTESPIVATDAGNDLPHMQV